jgi:hypothetical protein
MRQSGIAMLKEAGRGLRRQRLAEECQRRGAGLVEMEIPGFGRVNFESVNFDRLCERFKDQKKEQILSGITFATGDTFRAATWLEAVAIYGEAVAGIGR